jgi:hypothetical protein
MSVEENWTNDLRSSILARLAEEGIGEVRIEFDGCSDEGQVEDITSTMVDGTPGSLDWSCNVPGKIKRIATSYGSDDTGGTNSMGESRSLTMRELLDDWTYELLDEVGLDWVNNEGGHGEIIIVPSKNSVRCEINIRFIDVEHSEHEL